MYLTQSEMDTIIRDLFADTFSTQNDGAMGPGMTAATVLLDTGLDSLGFAILVTRLEEDLGFDPFALTTDAYYPVTYGDFLAFYLAHQPS